MNWWWRGALALVSAAAGEQVWAQTHAPHSTLADAWSTPGTPLDTWARAILFAAVFMVALYGFDRMGVATLRRLARSLPPTGTGTLALARHTLDSRRIPEGASFATSRTDMGAMVVAIAFVSSGLWGWTLDNAVHSQSQALTWDAIVSTSDAGTLAALGDTAGLVAVPFSQTAVSSADPLLAAHTTGMVYAVDPVDLEAVVPDGARPLGLQDGVVLSYKGTSTFEAPLGLVDVNTSAGLATVFHAESGSPVALATRSWAVGMLGDVPVSGALVRATDTSLTPDERFALIADAARAAGARVSPAPDLTADELWLEADAQRYNGVGLGFLIFLLVIAAVGTALFLSVRTARAHRRVRATVAALGAPPRALIGALMVDAGITLSVAVALGLPLGVLTAVAIGHPTLGTPGAPVDLGEILWGLGWNLTHLSWQPVAFALAGTWLLGVGVVFANGLFTHRRTPVEELREATKEGVGR